MKVLLTLSLFLLSLPCLAQRQIELDKRWGFITPCVTTKAEVERILGNSISEDKNHPWQSYDRENERITVVYNTKTLKKNNEQWCGDNPPLDIVLQFMSYTSDNIQLSELKVDLTKYKRDVGHTQREVSYWNQEEGILIVTKIVESKDKTKTEMVESVDFHPKPSQIRIIDPNYGGDEKPLTDEELKIETDILITRLSIVNSARGFIIDYGTDKEVAIRKAKILKHIKYRRFPLKRIEFIRGSQKRGIRTQFKLVPEGYGPPTPK
jgi:hypothetical protein